MASRKLPAPPLGEEIALAARQRQRQACASIELPDRDEPGRTAAARRVGAAAAAASPAARGAGRAGAAVVGAAGATEAERLVPPAAAALGPPIRRGPHGRQPAARRRPRSAPA